MKDSVEIKVSVEQLRTALQKRVVSENSTIIVDAIMNNLAKSPLGLEQLFMSLMGVSPISKYKEDDLVYVKVTDLASWNKDMAKNNQEGIIKQSRIEGVVIAIDLQEKCDTMVEYTAYDNTGILRVFKEAFYSFSLEPRIEDYMED